MVRVLGGNTCAGVTYCSALQAMPGHSLYPRLYHDISALVPHQTAVGAKRLKATHGISDGGSAGNRAAGSRGGLAWSILDLGARQPGWSGYSVYAANPHHTPNDNAGGLLTWLSGELFARRADQLQPVSISGHSRANGSSGDHGLPILRPTTAWHFLLHSGRLHVPNTAVRFEPCGGANQHCAGWLYRRVPIGTSLQPWAIADYRFVGHQAGSYLFALLIDLDNPYWVPISTAAIMQGATFRAVWHRNVHRIVGTFIGMGLAWIIFSMSPNVWVLAGLVILLSFVIEVLVTRNYGLAVIFITPLTVIFADSSIAALDTERLMVARMFDIVLGSAIGYLGGWVIHHPRIFLYLERCMVKR